MKYKKIWVAWALMVAGFMVTFYAANYLRHDIDRNAKQEFAYSCDEISIKINSRLHAHAQVLRSGAAFFSVSDTVTRAQWKAFVEKSNIKTNLPGIQGTGFSLIIPGDQLQRHIRKIRSEGFPEYTVKPESLRETYTSIVYLEPFSGRNLRAFGYDMFSEPVRREAMERARDLDVAALSGKVMLVQETGTEVQAGNLMYVPVYRKGAETNTTEQRRQAITGWVYSPYRMNDLMAGILKGWKLQGNNKFFLHIFDGPECTPQAMLFESHTPEEQSVSESIRFTIQVPVDFNGHQWTLIFTQAAENIFTDYVIVWMTLWVGILISVLLFFLSRSVIRTENRAYQIAEELTSELKESEKLVKEKEERLRMTVKAGNVGLWNRDLITNKTYFSPEWKSQLGYKDDELQNTYETWISLFHPDDLNPTLKTLKASVSEPWPPYMAEFRLKHKDGSFRWITAQGKVQFDQQGNPVYMQGTHIDFTNHKLAEEEIRNMNAKLEQKVEKRTAELANTNKILSQEISERRQAEERIRLVYDASPYSILLVDSKGIIRMANHTSEEYFGYNNSRFIGAPVEMLVPKGKDTDHKFKINNFFANLRKRKMGAGRDLFAIKNDGTLFPVEIGLTPIEINGEMMVLTNIIDITERKHAEDKIKQAMSEAEQANQAKSEFLSRMSHELRTPMNSILGFAQLMDMGELKPIHKKGVDHILKSGKHLLYLINEVLDISKIEAGHLTLSMEPIAVYPLVREVFDVIRPMAATNQIMLEAGNPSDNLFVKADLQRLKQVLLNLTNNAVKYNTTGGLVKMEMRSVQSVVDNRLYVRISVIDTGVGIATESINKLFNPFERIGAEKTGTEGTGLGLAVAQKLIVAMNGKIGVESESGKGSTFWIELPQSEGQIDRHERLSDQVLPEKEKTLLSGTILYIEDNASNIQLVEQILEAHRPGVSLITEMYGKNAVELATVYAPDLILLDLDLPDIHGSEVLRLLQGEPKTATIPVVVISADAMAKQIEKLMKAGAKNYLTKPINVVEFLKVVDEMISK
ncbi:MAG: CHASE domain-containing protein [Prolixibacteraceae bacterium]